MAESKPKLAEPRQDAQPGRSLSGLKTVDLMKTDAMIQRFSSYAPPGIDFRPLHASAALAIAASRDLQKAEGLTLIQAMMGVTRLGLEINSPLGHAYLIPFEMNGKMTIQVVIGYRGYVELAFRSGHLITIGGDVATVPEWEGKLFQFQKGTEPFLRHTFPPTRIEDEDAPAFAYAVAQLKDGSKFDVMPWAAIQRIKGGSQGYSYAKSRGEASAAYRKNPWVAHEWQMGVKTVLRRLQKTMQLTPALALATALDEMGEEREIDFGSIVDIDPSQWRDMTDEAERTAEGKEGEQHQVKTPAGKDEKKPAPQAETKPDAKPAATKKDEPSGDPRDQDGRPPLDGEVTTQAAATEQQDKLAPAKAAEPDIAVSSPPPKAANGAAQPAKDFWS